MDILGIMGSPRLKGNSDLLLDAALQGAQSHGAVIKKIIVDKCTIAPCREYYGCLKDGKCVIKDDMEAILRRMEKCDGFVFATPNHVRSVTAPMVNFLTRMLPLLELRVEQDSEGNITGGEFESKLRDKKTAMVISQGDPTISSFLVFSLLERNFIDFRQIS